MKPIQTLATALAVSTALTASAMAATKVGVIGAANPQVYATNEAGIERLLAVGDAIFLNDKLRTGEKGSAQLMFLDKSALTISPDSIVMIDKFVYNPAAKDGAMTINGAKGAFRFIGGALTKKSAVKIKTPVSTIGIRGGIVDTHIEAGGETDAVFLFGKEMTMTNGAGQTTSTTSFGTGLGLDTTGAAPVALPQNIIATRMTSSPTKAAENSAPPANPETINKIDAKIEATGGTATKAANTGSAPAPAPADNGGGDKPAPATDEGASNNNEGSAEPKQNTAANNDAAPAAPAAKDEGGQGGPFIAAADEGGTTAPAADGPAPTNNAATSPASPAPIAAAPAATGFEAGSGMKAIPDAMNVTPAGVGSNSQEQMRNEVHVAMNDTASSEHQPNNTIANMIKGGVQAAVNDGKISIEQANAVIDNPENNPIFNHVPLEGDPNAPLAPLADGSGLKPIDGEPTDPIIIAGDGPIIDPINDDAPNPPPAPINHRPEFTNYVMHNDLEDSVTTVGFSKTDLLTNVTDPEGDDFFIVPDSVQLADTTNGSLVGNSATGYTFTSALTDDIAPGDEYEVAVKFKVNDRNGNIVEVTRDIVITGQDILGGSVRWDTAGAEPTISSATHKGHFGFKATGTGAVERDGKTEAALNVSDNKFYAVAKDENVNGSSVTLTGGANEGEHYLTLRMPDGGTAGGTDYAYESDSTTNAATTKAAGFIVESENGQHDLTSGSAQWISAGGFKYAQVEWEGNSSADQRYARYYYGQSNILNGGHATDPAAQTAYDTLLADTATAAISNTANYIPVINYSFLPDLYVDLDSSGNDEFGVLNYNAFDDFGGAGSGAMAGAENRYGMLVDYGSKKYFTGMVDFTGNTAGSTGLIAAFGDINSGSEGAITYSAGGVAFDGTIQEWIQSDSNVSGSISPNEINRKSGTSKVDASDVYNDIDTANSPITALVLQGTNGTDHFAQAAIADDKADGLVDFSGADVTHHGFSAGLMVGDNGTDVDVTRIATGGANGDETDVTITLQSSGSHDVDASIDYVVKDTITNLFTAGNDYVRNFGSGASGDSAAIQKDMYAASDLAEENVIVTAGATNTGDVVCSSCTFSHWGVWATDFDNSVTQNTTALVPYVAGQVTSDATLATLSGLGAVTYTGQAAANFAVTDNGTGTTTMHNEIGTLTAVVDMGGRAIYSGSLDIDFTGIGGEASRDLAITNGATMSFYSGSNSFVGNLNRTFTDASGTVDPSAVSGTMNGVFFGDQAQEIGGSFYTDAATTNESIKAGGIYLGNR